MPEDGDPSVVEDMRLAGAVHPSERLHEVGVGVLLVPVHLEQHSADKQRKANLQASRGGDQPVEDCTCLGAWARTM
jgi:hypothetical protein